MGKFPARLPRSRLEKPRSREPIQPALSYEHIENFTKDLEVRRDLGNRASPVNRAHMKRPLDWQNNNSARALSFFVHSPVTARLQRENALFHVFVEDVNTRQWLSSSFSELRYSLLEFNSRKNCQVLTSWMRESKCDKVWSSATSLFKPSLLLKLPIIQNRPRKRVTLRQDKQWKLAF